MSTLQNVVKRIVIIGGRVELVRIFGIVAAEGAIEVQETYTWWYGVVAEVGIAATDDVHCWKRSERFHGGRWR